jgi:hypothetical protein
MNNHCDARAEASKRFVYCIVDNFPHKVVQA